eukprot:m.31855 g.31855  ORF g.31855 m.31855 type:complete len:272 (-) comp8354_c0_seq4:23-838(-)
MRISKSESLYIVDGIKSNVRQDGRTCDAYREFQLKVDAVSNANGSAKVEIGNTVVLAVVKANTGEPDVPGHGEIDYFVDCTPGASVEFLDRGGEALASEISGALKRMSVHGAIDTKSLSIIPGTSWLLRVDVLVLQSGGGNLYDCVAMAVKAALRTTKLPKLDIKCDENGDPVDFEVSPDPFAVQHLTGMSHFPLLVTVCEVNSTPIIDTTEQEECCVGGRLVVAVDDQGTVCGMTQVRKGGISTSTLLDMTRLAQKTGANLLKQMESNLP